MVATEPGPLRAALNGAALLLLWLLIAGSLLSLEGALAWLALAAALVGFFVVHLLAGRPLGVERSRLAWPPVRAWPAVAIPVSLLLVAGDIAWLISQDRLTGDSGEEPLVVIAAFVLLFPLLEEFGFRLWVQTPLERRIPPLVAVALVALAFSMLHSADSPLPQFIAGLAFGIALIVTGSIWVSVLMHLVQNLLLIVLGALPPVQFWATTLAAEPPPGLVALAFSCWGLAMIGVLAWYRRTSGRRSGGHGSGG